MVGNNSNTKRLTYFSTYIQKIKSETVQFQGGMIAALDCIHLVHAAGSRLTE
jgi:hypothetical protein